MLKRVLLAGILGGLTLFMWEFVAHMLTPLGEAGVLSLAKEAPVQAAITDTVPDPGFYIFPTDVRPGMSGDQKNAAMQHSMERAKVEPAGMMVVFPKGRDYNFGAMLGGQFVSDVLSLLIAAFLLSKATALKPYASRVVFVGLMGLLPGLQVDVANSTWYGFPATYCIAQIVVHVVGFLLAGVVLAKLVRPMPA